MNREPTITDALERTVEAGQSLVARRIDLLVAEIRVLFQGGGTLLFASVIAVTGWIYLMRGLTHGLSEHYPRYAIEVAVGAVHLGAATLVLMRRRAR